MISDLGLGKNLLVDAGGIYTAEEISRQPDLWIRTLELVKKEKERIQEFLDRATLSPNCDIILAGAGSSAYIGNSLQYTMQQKLDRNVKAIPTTSLVSHPDLYLRKAIPTLMISFARSGDSPESCAAVSRANHICRTIHHLVITCNPHGRLAGICRPGKDFVFLLPPESNDQSLAMTSSFTSMLLAGILISHLSRLESQGKYVELLAKYGENLIEQHTESLRDISELNFSRAVFLGSGPFQGIAQESHLKLQELTDGRIICKHDSFLGFRHGPKAVIDTSTLLVYLLTNNTRAIPYEIDLAGDIEKTGRAMCTIGVSEHPVDQIRMDLRIYLSDNKKECLPEEYLAVVNVLPAQMLGFFKALNLGLRPDMPSAEGNITRVVTGVTIYPFDE
jgi:tagatose-6-phosphate ketose/aldose isomerase